MLHEHPAQPSIKYELVGIVSIRASWPFHHHKTHYKSDVWLLCPINSYYLRSYPFLRTGVQSKMAWCRKKQKQSVIREKYLAENRLKTNKSSGPSTVHPSLTRFNKTFIYFSEPLLTKCVIPNSLLYHCVFLMLCLYGKKVLKSLSILITNYPYCRSCEDSLLLK